MNVLELLDSEIRNQDWSLDEKARYLYIRSCQMFSYDPRFSVCDGDLEYDIRYRLIDLEDVDDFRVVCTSFEREVFSTLLRELLGIDAIVHGSGHAWTVFNNGKRTIRADATNYYDISRIKFGLKTYGYKPQERYYDFEQQLTEMDKKIGYIDSNYNSIFLKDKNKNLFNEYLEYCQQNNEIVNDDDFSVYKMNTIRELFNDFSDVPDFSDVDYYISYLFNIFFGEDILLQSAILYEQSDDDWDFVNIYPIRLTDDIRYYILHKVDGRFRFYEINRSDAIYYANNLEGTGKKRIISSIF